MSKARLAYLKFKLIFQFLVGCWGVYYVGDYYGLPGWIGWPAGIFMVLFVIMFNDSEKPTREIISKSFKECD